MNNSVKRSDYGAGSVKCKTRTNSNGQTVKYWEARVSLGRDEKTGEYKRKTVTASTKKECVAKMTALIASINAGTYEEMPAKKDKPMTVGEWLDIWQELYLDSVKPGTAYSYKKNVKVHISPTIGKILLKELTPEDVQGLYRKLKSKGNLSAKTIRNIHGTLHKALAVAVKNKHIEENPADNPDLAKANKPKIQYLDSETDYPLFLKAIEENKYKKVYFIALFTGMREAEVLGLTWDKINFKTGEIDIQYQLQRDRLTGEYGLVEPKCSEARKIKPMPSVMAVLKERKLEQFEERSKAAENKTKYEPREGLGNLVFTNEIGQNLTPQTIYNNFKAIAAQIGRPELRVHDLRHTYAITALENGDDPLTVARNLGHRDASFTLNVYATVSKKMREDSSTRMEKLYQKYVV